MAPTVWDETLTDHKRRQRERILQTAAELIAERGMADVAMSVLARRAGVARATLYNYFPDIEHVVTALVADQAARFRRRLDQQLAEAADPPERLHRYLLAVHEWATRRTGRHHTDRRPSPQLLTVVHEPLTGLRELLATIVADGVTTGVFAADIDPNAHAELIFKLLMDPAAADPDGRQQLVRFIQRGLTPPDNIHDGGPN